MAQRDETVIESYDTAEEAWAAVHRMAPTLVKRGKALKMGLTVRKIRGAYAVVLVKR